MSRQAHAILFQFQGGLDFFGKLQRALAHFFSFFLQLLASRLAPWMLASVLAKTSTAVKCETRRHDKAVAQTIFCRRVVLALVGYRVVGIKSQLRAYIR